MTALARLSIVLLCSLASSVEAATFVVDTIVDDPALTSCDDATASDCSLHGAIVAANALADANTVVVPAGTYVLTQAAACVFKSKDGSLSVTPQTPLCVSGQVTVEGAGATTTVIDGNDLHPVLIVGHDAVAELRGVTLRNGVGEVSGGGVNNQGILRLMDSVVSNNTLPLGFGGAVGAGIYNADVLTLLRTTVTGNTGIGDSGGGIYNDGFTHAVLTVIDSTVSQNAISSNGGGVTNGGVATINGSAITGNTAVGFAGGGIYNSGTLTVANSTISGNHSGSSGAGLSNGQNGSTELNNVTITNNTSGTEGRGQGAGIDNALGHAFVLRNTIVAGNIDLAGTPAKPDCDARPDFLSSLTSQGHNLIGNVTGCDITGDTSSNLVGVDPGLGALADNGGFTQTHGLLAGSPAIDAGDPAAPGSGGTACATDDERAVLRPLGAACDIGAFERSTGFAVTRIRPSSGGNNGSIIVVVSGGGLTPGATVALHRAAHADIAAAPLATEAAGAALTAAFDLTNADVGSWDVVVTNPDLTSATLPGAFTVEAPRAADLFAIMVSGRSGLRIGQPTRFAVLYGNHGNTDAVAVPLTLELPASFAREFLVTIAAPPPQPNQPFDDYDGVPLEVRADGASTQVDIPLLLPLVPAGFTGLLQFTLNAPAGNEGEQFEIGAFLGTPWFADGTVRSDVVAEAAMRARQMAADRLGISAGPELDPTLIAYETAALDLAVAASRDEIVAGFGQNRRVYSVPYFAIDLAGYVAAQTLASVAPAARASWLAHVSARLAAAFGLAMPVVEAQTICPPCKCDEVVPGCSTCSNSDCAKIKQAAKDFGPKKPPSEGLTPAECRDMPKHVVSSDGTRCVPDGSHSCPIFSNPFLTDPACQKIMIRGSLDPNDKAGSTGSGPERFVAPGTPLPYAIAFENLAAATAPAQTVVVTDQLAVDAFDLESFTLGPILIGKNIVITPPPGLTTFTGGADLRPAHEVVVRVDAGFDKATGIVTWNFTSLDPATLQTLTNPDEGFLPPNTDPPVGDAQVHFTILPKPGVATGTEIRNHARVVFDVNAPIDTPEWLNTIDADGPTSQVDGVDPADCGATNLTVHWSGADVGSGIGGYALFVSRDGASPEVLIADTTATSTPFAAAVGHSYGFYTIARDQAGNHEPPPLGMDVVRFVGNCAGNDLAVTKIAAPKTVTLNAKNPTRLARVNVRIQNRSAHTESIPDVAALAGLVHLEVESLTQSCPAPVAVLHSGRPQKALPVTLKSKKTFSVAFDLTIDCANDPMKSSSKSPGHEDYSVRATVNHAALGSGDAHPADDVCPRIVTPPGVLDPFPNAKLVDKGCGAKKADKTFGAPVLVDVVMK